MGERDTAETSGLEGKLHTNGPYAYTRNPQYVGMILGRIGMAAVTNSRRVAFLGTVQIGWVFLLPFVEEPWLKDQFGDDYDRYREHVPRFIGWNSLP
jgi:protein-S-isoprenylcysteine O-methyltransferase Ste14